MEGEPIAHSPPRAPLLVHALPQAPVFTGREMELQQLRDFWNTGRGVASLIGIGGAGKTALIQRFVTEILDEDPPEGLLVWSFYDDPDGNAFLQTAFDYFAGGNTQRATGAGWFHLLKEALERGGRHLLVLDGLERVQRPTTDASGIFGALEDPLLRGLLRRLVHVRSNTRVVITSRFPLSDLERSLGDGYSIIDVDQLDVPAGRRLLETRGVKGGDSEYDAITDRFGRHALTLDLLAGALSAFWDGDPAGAEAIPLPEDGERTAETRLTAVLRTYEQHLSERSVALLSRLCVFRFGAQIDALRSVFLEGGNEAVAGPLANIAPEDLEAELISLADMHLLHPEPNGTYTVHPAVRDHFYSIFRDPGSLHHAVSKHFALLTKRPGIGAPTDKQSLDLLEELVHHALSAGETAHAVQIYSERLGGDDHLNTKLGEYGRTHRMLQAFPECPDTAGMYHCLRAFGHHQEALNWRPQNRYIGLALGNLVELSRDPDEKTRRVARSLQGQLVPIPDRAPDYPVCPAQLHLVRGEFGEAERIARHEVAHSTYHDDVVRNELALADACRGRGNLDEAEQSLDRASDWALASGSSEHLCLMHLVRARVEFDANRLPGALRAAEEGLVVAEEAGFRLWASDLLSTKAQIQRAAGDPEGARLSAQQALEIASDPEVLYLWGQAAPRRVLADLAKDEEAWADVRDHLVNLLQTQRAVGDPQSGLLEREIAQVKSRLATDTTKREDANG